LILKKVLLGAFGAKSKNAQSVFYDQNNKKAFKKQATIP